MNEEREVKERGSGRRRYAKPAVDIYSSASQVVLLADVPGVTKESLDVRLEGDELVLEGAAAGRAEAESRLPWGYYRRFRLSSAIEREAVHARLENGVVRIELGKVGAGGARRVEVE